MRLGMIGLGRMGGNLARRLMRDGHETVVFDVSADAVAALASEGADGSRQHRRDGGEAGGATCRVADDPRGAHGKSGRPGRGDELEPGDIIIDGGNSNYRDDVRRAAKLKERGIHYVDVGTSGGVFGLERGYCLMVGGDPTKRWR